jgi:hypothetical protein
MTARRVNLNGRPSVVTMAENRSWALRDSQMEPSCDYIGTKAWLETMPSHKYRVRVAGTGTEIWPD